MSHVLFVKETTDTPAEFRGSATGNFQALKKNDKEGRIRTHHLWPNLKGDQGAGTYPRTSRKNANQMGGQC